ncbi:hypothetical protein LEMLEM_LOCUS14740 [Lemmus lemmus]
MALSTNTTRATPFENGLGSCHKASLSSDLKYPTTSGVMAARTTSARVSSPLQPCCARCSETPETVSTPRPHQKLAGPQAREQREG